VYIADEHNNRIRKVTVSTGIISTIAGSSTSDSFSGDDGPATNAALYGPKYVAVDAPGSHKYSGIQYVLLSYTFLN
jgi:hypothetical protein